MKIVKISTIAALSALMAAGFSSCKNTNADFPDYEDGITAYFAHQYPVFTLTLGEDPEQDNSLDNEHKTMIYATHGGSYKSRDLQIEVVVDESLVNNLTFDNGKPVKVLPASYYNMASTVLTKKKDFLFGTEIAFTDAFFADPACLTNTYVIPLRITRAQGADHILVGTPNEEGANPDRTDATAWKVQPQDFTLYCVKYKNPWDATYLRHGVDQVTENGETSTIVRHTQYVEKNEVVKVNTAGLNKCIFPVSTQVAENGTINVYTCEMELTFNGDDCTISTKTPGMTASGNGKWVIDGEKKAYNNQDQNALYLNYTIDFGPRKYQTVDTLVVQSRNIAPEFFTPTYNK